MLNQHLIFLPMLALVLLTVLVWLWMYKTRIGEMRRKRIRPEQLATSDDARQHLQAVATPSENFSNLFEIPVLFYAAVLTLFVTQSVDAISLTLASLFVALRYAHSFIHVTYNGVLHRFLVYIAGSIILFALWVVIAMRLISQM